MAVDFDNGGVDYGVFHVRRLRRRFEKPLENLGFDPIPVAFEDCVPFAELRRQVTPRTACARDSQHSFNKHPVVPAAPAGITRLAQAVRRHHRPLCVRQYIAFHQNLESPTSRHGNPETQQTLVCLIVAGLPACRAAVPKTAAVLPEVAPLRASAVYPPRGVWRAVGGVLWLHGGVSPGQFETAETLDGQLAPEWLGRLAALGWNVWRYNRTPGHGPLTEGEAGMIRGLEGPHAAGYRRVIVVGFSRGAFIGMAAQARPDLVEAVVLLSPAAHGRRSERRGVAFADFAARLAAARSSAERGRSGWRWHSSTTIRSIPIRRCGG